MSVNGRTPAEIVIRLKAAGVAQDILDAAAAAPGNEAQFRGNLARKRVLERLADDLGFEVIPQEERTVVGGSIDAVYGRLLLEYEAPGTLTAGPSRANAHATAQVTRYLDSLAHETGEKPERLSGVATDGRYYLFVRREAGLWIDDQPVKVTESSTERLLANLYLLTVEKALTAESLARDFGLQGPVARSAVPVLFDALLHTTSPKVETIFLQWQAQFSQASGADPSWTRNPLTQVIEELGLHPDTTHYGRLLFSMHTYYALFIKVLALQIAHYFVAPGLGSSLPAASCYSSEELHEYLVNLERGGLFRQLGIINFLEGDFFSWYLESWSGQVERAVRDVLSSLSNYSLASLQADPAHTRDLLKRLYQELIPRQLRHDLGEYYTPDWLADRLLTQVGFDPRSVDSLHSKRLLDPACGSGTFLVLAIKRVRDACERRPIRDADILKAVLQNIVGFDLNPLAVMAARTNYLLALGPLLQAQRSFDVHIPVYTCDSIRTPGQGHRVAGLQLKLSELPQMSYVFNTEVGQFALPSAIVEEHSIDQFASLVETSVDLGYTPDEFAVQLRQKVAVHGLDEWAIELAQKLYARMVQLHETANDGIWARIIKNAFAPLFCGKFDYVVGNPPWVTWQSLPPSYRDDTELLWRKHHLFGPPARQSLASTFTQTDLSILMLYVSADDYLRPHGKLGFVITQSVFKSESGGRGFRQFRLRGNEPFAVVHVDDLSRLQPFAGASNRTAVVIIEKTRETHYPVSYTYWKGAGRAIDERLPLTEVGRLTKRLHWQAAPLYRGDSTSPWLAGRRGAIESAQRCVGRSAYAGLAHKGCDTRGANGVFWLHAQQTLPDGRVLVANMQTEARRRVPSIERAIEVDHLYPMLRGRNVGRWTADIQHLVLVPHLESSPSVAIEEAALKQSAPDTYAYLSEFRDTLMERPLFRNFDPRTSPFYMLYNVGRYSFAPYKVVWRELAQDMVCCVVGGAELAGRRRPVMVDHKLTSVGLASEDEAHFLCACLGNSVTRFIVRSYAVDTQISTHVLKYIAVPQYDPNIGVHHALATLSRAAHARARDESALREVDRQIDDAAAELWDLSRPELDGVLASLAELD